MTFSLHSVLNDQQSSPVPVHAITLDDIRAALRAGVDDFMAMPTHVIFLVLIYPVIGIVIARITMNGDLLPLAYPLAAGFALLGPFAALGMYELSRRREHGQTPTWRDAFEAVRSPGAPAIATLALVQFAIFIAWIATAQLLFSALAGDQHPGSIGDLLGFALGTPAGWALGAAGQRARLRLRCPGVHVERRLAAAPARPRRHGKRCGGHLHSGRAGEPWADGAVGADRSGGAVCRLPPGFRRAGRRAAGARPCHVAPLSPRRTGGHQPLTTVTRASLCLGPTLPSMDAISVASHGRPQAACRPAATSSADYWLSGSVPTGQASDAADAITASIAELVCRFWSAAIQSQAWSK